MLFENHICNLLISLMKNSSQRKAFTEKMSRKPKRKQKYEQ